jgi:hypothetical protein
MPLDFSSGRSESGECRDLSTPAKGKSGTITVEQKLVDVDLGSGSFRHLIEVNMSS